MRHLLTVPRYTAALLLRVLRNMLGKTVILAAVAQSWSSSTNFIQRCFSKFSRAWGRREFGLLFLHVSPLSCRSMCCTAVTNHLLPLGKQGKNLHMWIMPVQFSTRSSLFVAARMQSLVRLLYLKCFFWDLLLSKSETKQNSSSFSYREACSRGAARGATQSRIPSHLNPGLVLKWWLWH